MEVDRRIWHHIIITTYGAWLPGDERSFRTRHHREDIVGDYKAPPPRGLYTGRLRHSRKLLTQTPVIIMPDWRRVIGLALWREFTRLGDWVLAVAVNGQHVHMLVKVNRSKQKHHTGRAKRCATMTVRRRGWKGKLWAVRGKSLKVRNRAHQVSAFRYILRHEEEGAWIGVWRTEGGERTER